MGWLGGRGGLGVRDEGLWAVFGEEVEAGRFGERDKGGETVVSGVVVGGGWLWILVAAEFVVLRLRKGSVGLSSG